jgi:putative redox protein
MTSKIFYNGQLRTTATHLYSGSIIETDAPLDNQGLAERFSPTDLIATALGSCMLTIMGIKARDMGLNIDGASCETEKIMTDSPRRIGGINIEFIFPHSENFTEKDKTILKNAAHTCPVHKSLHPDMVINIGFNWD